MSSNYLFVPPKVRFVPLVLSPFMTPFVYHHIVYHRLQLTARLVGNGRDSRRLVLIPVSNGSQVERQAIVVSMLDGGFQPFLEEDGILNKEPIDMCTPQESDIIIHTWIAEVDMLVGLFRAPGGVEQSSVPVPIKEDCFSPSMNHMSSPSPYHMGVGHCT